MATWPAIPLLLTALTLGTGLAAARADVITDWNQAACEAVAKVGPGARRGTACLPSCSSQCSRR